MPIEISNLTPDKDGIHTYEIAINGEVIGRFYHHRRDGLSKCLKRAAQAAAHKDHKDLMSGVTKFIDLQA